jgi:hypothetical protein
MKLAAALLVASLACGAVALAQDGPSSAGSAGSLQEASRAVGDGSGSVGDGSGGSLRSGPLRDISRPVRDGRRKGMRSGPVSELSSGPIGQGDSVYGDGSIGSSSRGAVTQPLDLAPLRMERPVTARELRQLEDEMRAIEPLPLE